MEKIEHVFVVLITVSGISLLLELLCAFAIF